MSCNLLAVTVMAGIIIPKMNKNRFGSKVHISSIDALSGDSKPQDAYGASKAAMIRLSKSLAIQFGQFNIRSNSAVPGIGGLLLTVSESGETRMYDSLNVII